MKEMFEDLWKVALRLMSVISILVFTIFVCLKISQFYLEIENMKLQLENMNARLTRVEQKVDMIMEYLLREQAERTAQQSPAGK